MPKAYLHSFHSNRELQLGIVGLSVHSAAFSELLNDSEKDKDLQGCRITKLYHPKGNPDVDFTVDQLKEYQDRIMKSGVQMVSTIDELIESVDGVLIETNDGRPHMEQVKPVLKSGKPVFVDKPVAESLKGVIEIFREAEKLNVPIFSSSSLRYITTAQRINQNRDGIKILGADIFSPAPLEKSHTDLFWYGIHGVELLYTIMGTGCKEVMQVKHTEGEDIVLGYWDDDRMGVLRGIRNGKRDYGGTAFAEKEIIPVGSFEGYRPLVVKIVEFFLNNLSPVASAETIEIYAFMEAAMKSAGSNGKKVQLATIMKKVTSKY